MKGFEFLDEKYTRYMLECFSNATGLYLKGIDPEGEVFLELENLQECEFCGYVRSCNAGACTASYQQACQEAAKWKEPYFFRCHAGLVMWAVPIIVEEQSVGCLICGQVLLWEIDAFFIEELEEMNQDIENFGLLCEKARKLKVLSPHKSQSVADMLQAILNYLSKANAGGYDERLKTEAWRNVILNHMDERKNKFLEDPFDYDRHLKKEKMLLQAIRTGQRDKVSRALPGFLTDIYVLSNYSPDRVKVRVLEFMALVSRAIVEAGLDSHIAVMQNEKLFMEAAGIREVEVLFDRVSTMVDEFMEDIFILGETSHRSVLKAVREYIGAHYREALRIEDLAAEVGLSDSYLSHLFKETFNYTVNDYITRVRVENSVRLMEKRELTLREIAAHCGFKSPGYFSKVFKKYLGVTPREYRNRFIE